MTDLKKTRIIVSGMFLFLSLMIIGLASASILESNNYILLSDTNLESNILFGDDIANNFTLQVSSSIDDYVEFVSKEIYYPSGTDTKISLDEGVIDEDLSISGWVYYDDGNEDGYIAVDIEYDYEEINQNPSGISITDPADIDLIKGQTTSKEIQIIVPSNYGDYVNLRSVTLDNGYSGFARIGDVTLGPISSGQQRIITIHFDAQENEVENGDYPMGVNIIAEDSHGFIDIPKLTFNVKVKSSINPTGLDTFSTRPSCSLSATTLNLNNTYSFNCQNVGSNIQVSIPSSDYYIGTGVPSVGLNFQYTFTPTKYGETTFKAEFIYSVGSSFVSIFEPFTQDIRISSAGSLVPGTSLKFIFTPKLDEATGDEESFLIQLVDNKTGSLVQGPRIWINAMELNSSTGTFEYSFEPNTDYEIRGKAEGYEDLVQTININPQKIEIRISPGLGDTSTMFNITTSVENATLRIQDKEYSGFYYGVLPGGTVEIKAIKDGYKTEIINFTVDDRPKIVALGGEFKKDISQNFTLNKEGNWIVYYKKSMDVQERTEYVKGTGDLITFIPEKKGTYVIEVDGIHVGTFEIPKFSFKNKWGFFPAWVWLLFGGILVIVILIVIARKRAQGIHSAGQEDGAGLSFNVGDD